MGVLVKIVLDYYAAFRLVHQSRFLILNIIYHRERPISENLNNFTLQRGFRVYKVEGFFTGDCGLKQLYQPSGFQVLSNHF